MHTPSSTQNTQEMNKLQNYLNAIPENGWVDLQEIKRFLAEQTAKTDRQIEETNRQIEKNDRLITEKQAKTERQIEKTNRQIKANDRLITKKQAETDRQMKELQKQYGGISNSNGDMAEEYFYRAFKRNKTFVNETYEKVLRNKCIDNDEFAAEFDLLLLNGKSATIIEVKYRAKPDNITIEDLISKIKPFKVLFPDYKNHNIYLGVAAMSFDKRLAKKLHKEGIATIHQEGKKMVVYDQELKVF
jgi:hypothetical protein